MALITHSEYQKLVVTTDVSNINQFIIIERQKVDTYLTQLIGSEMVTALQGGSHTELMPLVKNCLAQEIYRYFVEVGNVQVTPIGSHDRRSEFSTKSEFVDKQNKLKAISEVLRGYEVALIAAIEAGSYTEEAGEEKLSQHQTFSITSIGD